METGQIILNRNEAEALQVLLRELRDSSKKKQKYLYTLQNVSSNAIGCPPKYINIPKMIMYIQQNSILPVMSGEHDHYYISYDKQDIHQEVNRLQKSAVEATNASMGMMMLITQKVDGLDQFVIPVPEPKGKSLEVDVPRTADVIFVANLNRYYMYEGDGKLCCIGGGKDETMDSIKDFEWAVIARRHPG